MANELCDLIPGVDYIDVPVALNEEQIQEQADKITIKVLNKIDVKPTPIESVDELRKQYPEGDLAPTEGYDGLFLIESGNDKGYLYFFDNINKKWTRTILYEDSTAIEELKANKVNKDMIDWGAMPTTITDKNTFYKEVSKVFATADHSIYMFGTPEELQRVWDIWGKPTGLKATHAYIAINPISNKSSRHAFIMWVFSSNYATPYFRIISGYAGSYLGSNDKGWVDVNKLATLSSTTSTEPFIDLGIKEWNKQQVTLPLDKLNQCKGLKIWVKLNVPTQGGGTKPYMVARQVEFYRDSPIKDYGFVTIPDVSKTYGQAILLPQVNIETGVLRITSSEQNGAGAVPSDVVIVYAQGIK